MFKIFLNKRHAEIGIDFDKLSKLTENMVSSDIDFIVNKAAHTAAIADCRTTFKIIKEVIDNFKPSVSKRMIDSYKNAHEKFENNDINTEETRTRIGFK